MFQRITALSSSGPRSSCSIKKDYFTLRIKAPQSLEMSRTTHPLTQHHISEDLHLQTHCCESFKCYILFTVWNIAIPCTRARTHTHTHTAPPIVWAYHMRRPRGQDSVVGIATRYGLDGPGIESRWGRDFSHTSRPALGPTQPPIQWVPGLSRG
jgi:hypothetical protein